MVKLIGEIGINHNGKIENVFELVDAFQFLDVIKMQKLEPKVSISPDRYNAPHPVPDNAFGDTYGKHKEFLEFTKEQYRDIKQYIITKGMKYSSSVFDVKAAEDVIWTNPEYIKIPSARCNDFELLRYVIDNFNGEIHVSTGMTEKRDRDNLINFFMSHNAAHRLVVYECTSDYYDDGPVYLSREMAFSCHVPDIFYAKAAILNGAKLIEYHITTDRSQKGTDHKISLLPSEYLELKNWIKDNNERINRLRFGKPEFIPDNEIEFRKKLWKATK